MNTDLKSRLTGTTMQYNERNFKRQATTLKTINEKKIGISDSRIILFMHFIQHSTLSLELSVIHIRNDNKPRL